MGKGRWDGVGRADMTGEEEGKRIMERDEGAVSQWTAVRGGGVGT